MPSSTRCSLTFLTQMISLPNSMQSPTSQSLTDSQRDSLIEFLAKYWLDSMDVKDLERFFYDTQTEYLTSYTDTELIGEIEDVTSDEDFQLLISEVESEA